MRHTGRREKETENLKKFYLRGAKRIEKKHFSSAAANRLRSGTDLARERTDLIDSVVTKAADAAWNGAPPKGVSVVALGGYGRGDLCPFSDIDLLVLYKPGLEKIAEQTAENIFYPLWDMKLDVGHAVRTVGQCAELCGTDFVTLTSLLDSRFVAGDAGLRETLRKTVETEIMPVHCAGFIEAKLAESSERRKKFGSSVWMLEPNVKEAEGAIRDLNTMLWVAQAKYKVKTFDELLNKGIMSEKEFRVTMKCMSFLLLVRSHLHYIAGRKHDILSFDFQSEVARFFGHRDSSTKAVEKFMRIYYLRAGLVSEHSRRLVERFSEISGGAVRMSKIRHLEHGFTISDGVLSVTGKNIFRETPVNLARAFYYADRHNAKMSRYLSGLIREHVPLIDEEMRRSPDFSRIFLGLLKNGKNVYKTLSLMNRLRFLAHYIPEFGKVVCMMQHNAYHLYTVDVHSLFLASEAEKLFKYEYEREFPLFTKVAESVVSRDILYLACLFHDIGKGGPSGSAHERTGKEMVRKINRRLGLARRDAEVLEFLVEKHQAMSDFSQKQDISDPELVSKFARSVGDEERLSLLYILTFADLRSVGPDVWNNWKDMLLRDLYLSSLRVFESGRIDRGASASARKRMVCAEIARISGGKITAREAAKTLEMMPESYLFGHSPATMERHIKLIKSARGRIATDVVHHEKEGYDEFIFWGKDRRKLFCSLCGAVSVNGLNILGARAVSSSDGMVLDILYVNKLGKSAADSPRIWRKLEDDIGKALSGGIDLDDIMKKRTESAGYGRKIPGNAPRVAFDNLSSDRATIAEVFADDRPGLLYEITRAIAETDVSISYAKISTRAEQVFDTFYLTGRGGRKIDSPDAVEKLKKILLKVCGGKERL